MRSYKPTIFYLVWIFVVVSLLLYNLPFWILGQKAFVLIHDNLDSDFVHLKMLVESNFTYSFSPKATIENVFNGIPRSSFRSGLNFVVLIFDNFPPFQAYCINHFIIHALGFWGMYLLVKTYFVQETTIALLIALAFAILPSYNVYGLSIMGQPLLLWSFLSLRKGESKWYHWFIILLYPFYSFIVYVGPFLIISLVFISLYDYVKVKKTNKNFLLATVLLCISFLLVESQMIVAYFTNSFISHRKDYALESVSFKRAIFDSGLLIYRAFYHIGEGFYGVFILFLFLITRKSRFTISIAIIIVLIALLFGFYPMVRYSVGSIFQAFNFSRFTFLLPLLWWILFSKLIRHYTYPLQIGLTFLLIGVVTFHNPEFMTSLKILTKKKVAVPSYQSYFAEKQFTEISKHIAKDKSSFRVVSVGLSPTIAQYNGFYTLDGYQANYPLEYKKTFGKIITDELSKNKEMAQYFYGWGNRVYVFSDELWKKGDGEKIKNLRIRNLAFDTHSFKKMGGKYIFSAVAIENASALGWQLEKVFDNNESAWRIYLYKV